MTSSILTLEILEGFAKGIAEVGSHYLLTFSFFFLTFSYLKHLLNEEWTELSYEEMKTQLKFLL